MLAPALAPTDDEAAALVKVGFIIFGLMCLAFVAVHLSFARYLVYLIRQAILTRPGPADPAAVKMQRRTLCVCRVLSCACADAAATVW